MPEEPDDFHARLGEWLKTHVPRRRNTIRFLIPKSGSQNAFLDRDLIILARAIVKAEEWRKEDSEYAKLHTKYRSELHGILKVRFDRYAILDTWNYQEPKKCHFHIENHGAQGGRIPEAIDESVRQNLFIPEEFEDLVMAHAKNSETVAKLILELGEPRPNQAPCIPWLGDVEAKERLVRVCAKGKIAINIRGLEFLQAKPGEDADQAYDRMKAKTPPGSTSRKPGFSCLIRYRRRVDTNRRFPRRRLAAFNRQPPARSFPRLSTPPQVDCSQTVSRRQIPIPSLEDPYLRRLSPATPQPRRH